MKVSCHKVKLLNILEEMDRESCNVYSDNACRLWMMQRAAGIYLVGRCCICIDATGTRPSLA